MKERLSYCGVAIRDGLYFVARRKPGGSQGGKWEFPGGKAEAGETGPEALIREFEEELGVRITVGERFFTGTFANGSKTYKLEAYGVILGSEIRKMEEHDEVRWGTLAQLSSLDFSDSDRMVLEHLKGLTPQL